MNPANLITDPYERKARLYPALLLLTPVVVTAVGISSISFSVVKSLAATGATLGGLFFLSQFARDFGKRLEKSLFEHWGGMPSVTIFRNRDERLDPITKKRYHNKLARLVSGTRAQSPAMEKSNPKRADQFYASWSNFLRLNTRNTKKYSLLFQENISYGYRRNVLGLRPFGIILTACCILVASVRLYLLHQSSGEFSSTIFCVLFFLVTIFLLWIFYFNMEWVSIPAFAYSERLAEAVDELTLKTPKKSSIN